MVTKTNQKGFGVVEGLLLVVLVGIIGFAGWYVYDSNKKSSSSYDKTSSIENATDYAKKSTKSNVQSTDETANWLTFTPNSKLYTVKLPDGWTFMHQIDECDCLIFGAPNNKPGTAAIVEKSTGGKDGIIGYSISAESNDSATIFKDYQKVGEITAGKLKGTKYFYEQTTEPEGIGLEKGGKQYIYFFVKDGKGISLSYSINPGTEDQVELVEKSVKTLSIN